MLIQADKPRVNRGSTARWVWLMLPAGMVLGVIIAIAVFAGSRAGVVADSTALARVTLPLGGGSVVGVRAIGPNGRTIPVKMVGRRVIPTVKVAAGIKVSIIAVVSRPDPIGWLVGSRDRETLTLITPTSSLRDRYLRLAAGSPLRLRFTHPISTFAVGEPGAWHRRTLAGSQTVVSVTRPALAGTVAVTAAPRTWERTSTSYVTWFPAGAHASAVTSPSPGHGIGPTTPITITFSEPYANVLHGSMPTISPAVTGHWRPLDSHTLQFKPTGYGYGLSTAVTLGLPTSMRVIGGAPSWTVPQASSLRLNQILAELGYLPLDWSPSASPVSPTLAAQVSAALHPPAGQFSWKWGNAPAALHALWNPAVQTVVSQGALMAFEQHQGIYGTDPSPAQVWHALIDASIKHVTSNFGYTFVSVSESSQSLDLWHSGQTILTTAVNTGIPGRATATGTYPVFEHVQSTTMSGTNPDGTHYNDSGVPWVSYFNGGDALHGFQRASYGSRQSLGCVEMPPATAGRVYPYTPIGTIVHVA